MYLFWQVGQKQSEGDQWAEVLENSRLLGIFTEKESEKGWLAIAKLKPLSLFISPFYNYQELS